MDEDLAKFVDTMCPGNAPLNITAGTLDSGSVTGQHRSDNEIMYHPDTALDLYTELMNATESPECISHTLSPQASDITHTLSPQASDITHTLSPQTSDISHTLSPQTSDISHTLSQKTSDDQAQIVPCNDDTITPTDNNNGISSMNSVLEEDLSENNDLRTTGGIPNMAIDEISPSKSEKCGRPQQNASADEYTSDIQNAVDSSKAETHRKNVMKNQLYKSLS